MITEIKNFTLKSFKSYSTPQNFFKTKNIIFGYNGRGKSSLAEGIIRTYSTQETNNLFPEEVQVTPEKTYGNSRFDLYACSDKRKTFIE